jgi:hypothetical protein
MAGVGKTELARALAQEIASETADCVMWVFVADRPLADIHNEMARALGITFPPDADARSRYAALLAAFCENPRIVFLDDIRPSFFPDLQFCLPPSPPCAALVTSRQRELGLPTGAMFELDVMTPEQSLELLRGVRGLSDALDREPAAARDLCRLCAYIPLALDLAARRLLNCLRDSNTPIHVFNEKIQDHLVKLQTAGGLLESLSPFLVGNSEGDH